MLGSHVNKDLSAYCNHELADQQARRVAEHLLVCDRCRKEYEEIRLGVRLAEQLPLVAAPEALWSEIEALLDERASHPASRAFMPLHRWLEGQRRYRLAALAAIVLMVIGVAAGLYIVRSRRVSWEVANLQGQPRIGSSPIGNSSRLGVGDLLETDAASQAIVDLGKVGQVQVDQGTRIRLVRAAKTEYRFALERGRVHAKISAPPRFFFVDTPSAVAADLGCAYTLEVDNDGNGILHVTAGLVELALKGRISTVLTDASCVTRPGLGPGTPYADDASEQFRRALEVLDFGDNSAREAALSVVLAQARKRDASTLWNLLQRMDVPSRDHVYDRLAELVAPPEDVTREGVLSLDQKMLDHWWVEVLLAWLESQG